jgi:hypothetical protein
MTDYPRCDWGRHQVYRGLVGSLHGISACSECREDHDKRCGCERCRRVGLCPVHMYDLAACATTMSTRLVWGTGFGPAPDGLVAVDAADYEDWVRVETLDPGFAPGPEAETVGDPRWVMVVDADASFLQKLQEAGEIRGFAPRFA